jgi:hypothetical protein
LYENRVLREIFGPKRGEVTGEWTKLHNGELHNFAPFKYYKRVKKELDGRSM